MDSILTSVKKMLGLTEEYEHFDVDIIMHINSVFMILNQLGVGPESGFSIANKFDSWDDFLPPENKNFEPVKTFMYLKVRTLFDPPASSIVMEAINRNLSEMEWRIYTQADLDRKEESQNGK